MDTKKIILLNFLLILSYLIFNYKNDIISYSLNKKIEFNLY